LQENIITTNNGFFFWGGGRVCGEGGIFCIVRQNVFLGAFLVKLRKKGKKQEKIEKKKKKSPKA